MLAQQDFGTWTDLEAHVQKLAQSNVVASSSDTGHFSHLLFRGQASSEWSLDTTLERSNPKFTRLAEYYRIAGVAKPQVETFTDRTWSDLDYVSASKYFSEYDPFRRGDLPAYDYLVYLRHHGFPSPLLDWSRSLYVAAYFAFQAPKTERVALFVYQEFAGSGKHHSSIFPQILVLGPNVRSHPRHFLQQGEYTVCAQYSEQVWHLASHSSVFGKGDDYQDRLWKFSVPATEAAAVMKRLDEYNINAFSLFQSEEALLQTIARRLLPP